MSLADAVLEIADRMDEDNIPALKTYANVLRIAVKASLNPLTSFTQENSPLSKNWQEETDRVNAAKAEKQRLDRLARKEESASGIRMVVANGGNSDGVCIPIDPSMPVGAKTFVTDEVYVLGADGELHFSEEDTKKVKP